MNPLGPSLTVMLLSKPSWTPSTLLSDRFVPPHGVNQRTPGQGWVMSSFTSLLSVSGRGHRHHLAMSNLALTYEFCHTSASLQVSHFELLLWCYAGTLTMLHILVTPLVHIRPMQAVFLQTTELVLGLRLLCLEWMWSSWHWTLSTTPFLHEVMTVLKTVTVAHSSLYSPHWLVHWLMHGKCSIHITELNN